ncbi:YwqJ-related putative deaminase [Streptomyces sp. NPDC047071]|uniref:YwqJ-related putative deaminase n=1 Tax=Streptomyces sp. NPDC047071 TaxID=3154808 RepID=UPI003455CFA1
MSNEPIDPNAIPQFTGDLEQLELDVADLRGEASRFRDAGGDVHSDFQGLSAFYEAPEAEQLFATTKPVQTKTDAFADDLEKVAQALSTYATAVRPIAKKLKQLQAEASAFYIDEVSTDDDWRKDDDKRDHNNRLVEGVKAATQAFRAAEIDCHNKITGLVGGVRLRPSSDGTSSCDTYGYTDEVLDQAEEFPWGGTVEKDRDGVDWLLHKAKDVGKGFFVDGLGGAAGALLTLVGQGEGGWGAAGEAWTNLGKLATGLTLSMGPAAGVFWLAKDDQLPSWLRDSRRAVVDTGKGLIAYDEWSKNPARAAGLVGFNALTILATRGAGAAAKGGAAAKTLSAVSKVGRAVDPFTYAAKGVTFTVSKVGDLLAPLRAPRAVTRLDVPAGSYHLVDDAAPMPPRPAAVPDNARLYADSEGNTLYMTRDGAIVDDQGRVLSDLKRQGQGEGGLAAAERAGASKGGTEPALRAHERQPVLVGARSGDGAPGSVSSMGDDLAGGTRSTAPEAGHRTPGGAAPDPHPGPAASHEPRGGPSDHPSAHHDNGATHTGRGGSGGGHAGDGPRAGAAPHGDELGTGGRSGPEAQEPGAVGRPSAGVPLEPQPDWHGMSADAMRHHRRPATDVSRMTPEERLAALEEEALALADDARNSAAGNTPGQHQLASGCAGSFLHDQVITVHSSTTKMHGQKLPHTHRVLQDILKRISDDVSAGIIPRKGIGHGKCAEISLISDRLHQLDPTGSTIRTVADARRVLEGGEMHTRRIGDVVDRKTGEVVSRHGEYMRPCDTCKHVLPQLGIRAHE